MSLVVYKEMRFVDQVPIAICKLESGSEDIIGKVHRSNKLTDLKLKVEIEVETGFPTQEASVIEKETLFADEMLIAVNSSRKRCDKESEFDNRANADGSTIKNETINNTQIFETYQISDDDNSSIGSIQAKKQKSSRMYYLIRGTVTMKISLYGSRRRI
ncbi:hypothetical protein BDZ45DRAFT_700004 [Acephala macrosclerotiorum]|nr:hypothetical protein BDZ45DRAFT_700004 [Acephala macrosclerotiorum]